MTGITTRAPRRARSLVAALAASLCVLAVACGDDGDDEGATSTAAPTTTAAGDTSTTEAPAATSTTAAASTTAPAADAFPVTIEHKYGSTTIESAPERIVSVGFADQDFILAFGVVPVGIRDWYGDQPDATWPWAHDLLGGATPTIIPSSELDIEAVAALDPDLIIGISSGMTDIEYDLLKDIAPTIAQPGGFADYGTPWQEATRIIGTALGQAERADEIVAETEALFAAAKAEHPEFVGATAGVTFVFDGNPGGYSSQDNRSRFMTDLGFVIPDEFDEIAGDLFYFTISSEDISVLDTDVVVWIVGSDPEVEAIRSIALRSTLDAVAEGREVLTDYEVAGAFSFSSPLSLPYALEGLVPELALAVDGDPATEVPSAATLAG